MIALNELNTDLAARMCPRCGSDSFVYDTREQPDGSIFRRRKCRECGVKFETVERFSRYVLRKRNKFCKSLDIGDRNANT